MINNYSDFLIEKELMNWQKLNEEAYWEDVTNRMFDYLDDAFKKGENIFLNVLLKTFRYFKANPKMLALVVGLLIAKYKFTKQDIIDVMPDDAIVSAEELYAQSREGKGLPEDWDEETDETTYRYNVPITGNLRRFLRDLANRESSLDPEKINSVGYMGKYQFGEIALKDIIQRKPGETDEQYQQRVKRYWPNNFGPIRTEDDFNYFKSKFRNKGVSFWPEHKQDLAMKQLMKNNKSYLGDYINKWAGKKKKGVTITLSGLLAGAHLLGPSNVKDFLDYGKVSKDGYGTPITEYIEKFGGYDIKL